MKAFEQQKNSKEGVRRRILTVAISLSILVSCLTVNASDVSDAGKALPQAGSVTAGLARTALSEAKNAPGRVTVYVDSEYYTGKTILKNGTTFVGIREFTRLTEDAAVEWVGRESAAYVTNPRVAIRAENGKEYIKSNGRYFWGREKNFIVDGTMYVPLRAICAAFGMSVEWDASEFAAYVKRHGGTVTQWYDFYDSDEVYWLSKIIEAESRGEPMTGKIAVGNVVLNRVRSDQFPDTVYQVIFDRKHGVQFSPVADGSINRTPSADSVIAAKICLEGYTVSRDVLYFINASIAGSYWVTYNRPYVTTIGNHDFYA